MAIRQHKHSHDKMLTEIRNSQTLLLSFLLRHLPAYTTSRLYAVEPWRWTSPSFQPPRNWSPNFCQLHVRVYVSQRSSAAICNHMTSPSIAAWPSNRAWLCPGERMYRALFFFLRAECAGHWAALIIQNQNGQKWRGVPHPILLFTDQ